MKYGGVRRSPVNSGDICLCCVGEGPQALFVSGEYHDNKLNIILLMFLLPLRLAAGALFWTKLVQKECKSLTFIVLMSLSPLNFHPITNEKTTSISPDDLLNYIRSCGHQPKIIDLE